MFENDIDSKGLFTFYKQQAQFEQKLALQKRVQKAKSKFINLNKNGKFNYSQHEIAYNDIVENKNQSSMNLKSKSSPKNSFQQFNKAYIKKISSKKQLPQTNTKQIASQIVVILKGTKTKQDLKLNKLNLKYQMQDGHFLKEKSFDPLQDILTSPNLIPKNYLNPEEPYMAKKYIKRNKSLNDRYAHSDNQLQNQLILSKQSYPNRQNKPTNNFQGPIKIDMTINQLPEISRSFTSNNQSYNFQVHKRIPPKILASILKTENNEVLKQLRKAIDKQRQDEKRSSIIQRNHSFIQYGSFDYDRKELDIAKLNEKQRRMISILNKFGKKA